ncbi:hypothetical protein E3U43_006419 [Larimichthys crocea]|uniref:Uncharacterized protein n=1 Tax=Larimichthys crocea TaxID=215358 RepID=A0ACD3RK04_LARCR|nr:hypothetical protein E3U43_006419 [Larimichthys crocea]
MYCHVYGPVYGCLEHCVPNIQLQITEGKSSHVNIPFFILPFLRLPLAVRRTTSGSQRLCTDVSQQQHTINFCHYTSQTGKAEPVDSSHNNVSVDIFSLL